MAEDPHVLVADGRLEPARDGRGVRRIEQERIADVDVRQSVELVRPADPPAVDRSGTVVRAVVLVAARVRNSAVVADVVECVVADESRVVTPVDRVPALRLSVRLVLESAELEGVEIGVGQLEPESYRRILAVLVLEVCEFPVALPLHCPL